MSDKDRTIALPGRPSGVLVSTVLGALILGALILGAQEALPFVPGAPYSDATTAHYPAAEYLGRALRGGTFPLWWPEAMGGAPFAANPLNRTAYPLQYLAVVFPPAVHLNLMLVLHIAIGAWGMFRWARLHAVSVPAACVGAAAFVGLPRVLAHTGAGHLDIVYALAWWPHWMAGLHAAGEHSRAAAEHGRAAAEHGRAAAEHGRATARIGLLSAGLAGGLLVTADVRTAAFALTMGAFYLLARLFAAAAHAPALWAARARSVGRVVLSALSAAVVVVLLSAGMLASLLVWLPSLTRAQLSSAEAAAFSLEPAAFVGVFIPALSPQIEFTTAVGLFTLFLAVVGAWARPRRSALWAVFAAACALYALGPAGGLWPVLTDALPVLRLFRVPARAWLAVSVLVSLFAALGAHTLMTADARTRRSIGRFAVAMAALCGACAFVFAPLPVFDGRQLVAVYAAVAAGVVAVGLFARRFTPVRVAAVCAAVIAFEGVLVGSDVLEWRPGAVWRAPALAVAEGLRDAGAVRVFSPDYALPQEAAFSAGLPLFYGADPFQVRGASDAIRAAAGLGASTGYSIVAPPFADAADPLLSANRAFAPDLDVLARWHVSHIVARGPWPALEARGFTPEPARIPGLTVYALRSTPGTAAPDPATGWPARDPALPTPAFVAHAHTVTGWAHAVSLSSFAVLSMLLLVVCAKAGRFGRS